MAAYGYNTEFEVTGRVLYVNRTRAGNAAFVVVSAGGRGNTSVFVKEEQVPIGSIKPGAVFIAKGYKTRNRNNDYADYITATSVRVHEPAPAEKQNRSSEDLAEAAVRCLTAMKIKGVGPGYASRIVRALGPDAVTVLDASPASIYLTNRLPQGEKLTTTAQASVYDHFSKMPERDKELRPAQLWLLQQGVSPVYADKILQKYGTETIDRVSHNPYLLVGDVRGIAFRRADEIATSMGVPADSPYRLRAALVEAMDSVEKEGSTAAPVRELVTRAATLLQSNDKDLIEQVLMQEGDTDDLTVRDGEAYFRSTRQAEKDVARHLARIMASVDPPAVFESDLQHIQTGITYSPSQREAILAAATGGVTVITGGPGTGKTTIINGLLSLMARYGYDNVLLAAPTGRAAKRMEEATATEAKTIHRLLITNGESFHFDENIPLSGDMLIVDETSMVDTSLMRYLLSAVPSGMQVVFVGDSNQLPSIGAGSVLRDLVASGAVRSVHLNEIFRQEKTSEIITAAADIREGRVPPQVKGRNRRGGDFFFIKHEQPVVPEYIPGVNKEEVEAALQENAKVHEKMMKEIVSLVKDRLPAAYGWSPDDIQVISPRYSLSQGDGSVPSPKDFLSVSALNRALQAALNPNGQVAYKSSSREIRVGDRVLQTENNYDKEIVNGAMGVVTKAYATSLATDVCMKVDFGGHEVTFTREDAASLDLAYACTVHKSQGMEFKAVIVPVCNSHKGMLNNSLIYTAITRGRELDIVIGDPETLEYAVSNRRDANRMTHLQGDLIKEASAVEIVDIKPIQMPEEEFCQEEESRREDIDHKEEERTNEEESPARALQESDVETLRQYGVEEAVVAALAQCGEATIDQRTFHRRSTETSPCGEEARTMDTRLQVKAADDGRIMVLVPNNKKKQVPVGEFFDSGHARRAGRRVKKAEQVQKKVTTKFK